MWCARWRRRICRDPTTASPIRAIPRRFCLAGSTASTASAANRHRPIIITANTASFSIDGPRETMMQTVKAMIAGRRSAAGLALRAAAAAACAIMVCGCNTDQQVTGVPEVPVDYRLRHPITLHEANRTLELFLGTNRGELNPTQRAQVLAFGLGWKRAATGGVMVERPVGSSNERSAADAMREIVSILAA